MNKRKRTDNTSGVVGVSWSKNTNSWISQIEVDKRALYLGAFEDFEDAVESRKQAEEKYFGEYRYKGGGRYFS